MNIDWKMKLSSRKFWVAVIGLVTAIALLFGASDSDASKIAAAITALGSVVSYILGESLVDANRKSEENNEDKQWYFVNIFHTYSYEVIALGTFKIVETGPAVEDSTQTTESDKEYAEHRLYEIFSKYE